MKNLFCLIPFLWLLQSCASYDSEKEDVSNEATNVELDSSENLDYVNEIIDFGEEKFEMLPTNDTTKFQGVEGYEWTDEYPHLKWANGVSRNSDTLLFLLENGDTTMIIDVPYIEGDENTRGNEHLTAQYSFQGSVPGANYWHLHAGGYEGHWSVLINKKNGFKVVLSGNPISSPNGEYLMAVNPDIESGYTINCLELFEVLDDSLREIGSYEPADWGPKSVKWISEDELIITKMTICPDTDNFEYCYENVLLRRMK